MELDILFYQVLIPLTRISMFQSSSLVANGSPSGTESGYGIENAQLETVGSSASTLSSSESLKAAYALLPQTPIRSNDAHLVEFSEAMRSTSLLHHLLELLLTCHFVLFFIYLVLRYT